MDNLLTTCVCQLPGRDDGQTTCWVHHNCLDGSCTHIDWDEPLTEEENYYD